MVYCSFNNSFITNQHVVILHRNISTRGVVLEAWYLTETREASRTEGGHEGADSTESHGGSGDSGGHGGLGDSGGHGGSGSPRGHGGTESSGSYGRSGNPGGHGGSAYAAPTPAPMTGALLRHKKTWGKSRL